MRVTRHSPDVPGTSASSSDGIQAPANTEATDPPPSARFQSSDQTLRWVLTSPSSIMRCQNSVNVLVPASPLRSTVTVLPSDDVWKGRPPASHIIAL